MKTRAAVLRGAGQDFGITELEPDPPKAGEVLIRYAAAGLCHSDDHLRHVITSTCALGEINQGYQDVLDGTNVRGVILHSAS